MRAVLLALAALCVWSGTAAAQRAETTYGTGAMGFVELLAGEMIPLAAETYQDQTKISPKVGARGGYLFAWTQKTSPHPWVLGFEAGVDWTRFTLDRNVLPEPAESSRLRGGIGARAGVWQTRRRLLFFRAAAALDVLYVDFSQNGGCGSHTSTALGAEMGGGLLVLFGRLSVGIQGNIVTAFHRDQATCVSLDYDSLDLDLILTLGVRI